MEGKGERDVHELEGIVSNGAEVMARYLDQWMDWNQGISRHL
jgi:hypothetical protein